jgi:riboflavin biosynthesis pyrimidine reductase
MPASAPAAIVLAPLLADDAGPGPVRGGRLPAEIEARYGSSLSIPLHGGRPTVIANFVSTLDGVASYHTPESPGGGEVSGFFEPDRFVMGTLRALADVVLIGAGTLRAAPAERWTADFIHPDGAAPFAALRATLGLRRHPLTAVVTASGSIDLSHPGLADPAVHVVIVTTQLGAEALERQGIPAHVDVRGTGDAVSPDDVLRALRCHGAELVLCEGGPHLLGQLVGARVVDEIFLTLAPQLAGRSAETPRLSLIEETAFDVASAPWARLVDLRRAGDHLFTRYRLNGGTDS